MNNTNNLDNFFSYISKAVIIIPIVVLVVSLFLRFNSPKNSSLPLSYFIPTTTPITTPTMQNNSLKFDLKGPYKCFYKDDRIEAKVYIKNKNVLAEINKDGKMKKYLLSPYDVFIVENMISSNFSGIENMISQYMERKINIKEILDFCKKADFDEKIFNLK